MSETSGSQGGQGEGTPSSWILAWSPWKKVWLSPVSSPQWRCLWSRILIPSSCWTLPCLPLPDCAEGNCIAFDDDVVINAATISVLWSIIYISRLDWYSCKQRKLITKFTVAQASSVLGEMSTADWQLKKQDHFISSICFRKKAFIFVSASFVRFAEAVHRG